MPAKVQWSVLLGTKSSFWNQQLTHGKKTNLEEELSAESSKERNTNINDAHIELRLHGTAWLGMAWYP